MIKQFTNRNMTKTCRLLIFKQKVHITIKNNFEIEKNIFFLKEKNLKNF